MKKTIYVLLFLVSVQLSQAQVSLSVRADYLGPRLYYLKEVSSLYSNDNSRGVSSPQFSVRLNIKKASFTFGLTSTKQTFSLKPAYYWYQNFGSSYGPLSYNKSMAYRELHFMSGLRFKVYKEKLQATLQGGAFILTQVQGKESFLGPFPIDISSGPSPIAIPAFTLFNPRIPGLMAELECTYRLKARWSAYASLSWRGLLNYMTIDELGGPKDDVPIPRLKRNFINLGLGISYTLLKGKEKEPVKKTSAKARGTHTLGLQGGYTLQDVQGSAFLQFIEYRKSSSWGLTYDYLHGKHLYLGTGIQYQQRGYSGVYEDFSKFPYVYDARVKKFYNYLAMPLRIGFKTGGKAYWHLGAAAVPALLLKAYSLNEELGASGQRVGLREVDEKPFLRNMDWAAMLETGMVLPLRKGFSLQSTLNWQHSLSNFYKPEYAFGQSLKQRSLGLQLGIKYVLANEKQP